MFQTYIKNYQSKLSANTWQQSLRNKEIARNSYLTHGDIKKAKAFVNMVSNFKFQTIQQTPTEQVIFSY